VYSETAFDLFQNLSLLSLIYGELSKHGVGLGNMTLITAGSLSEVNLQAYLPNYVGVVRVHFDRTEIQSLDLTRVDTPTLVSISTSVFKAMATAKPALKYKTHALTLNLHGKLSGSSASAFISKYVTARPKGLGPEVGRGVVFYAGADGSQLMSTLTLDLSGLVADALYVKLFSTWDGAKLEPPQLATLVQKHVDSVLNSVDLVLKTD
jgi:hypothetical protein